jgi:hypothetical protein
MRRENVACLDKRAIAFVEGYIVTLFNTREHAPPTWAQPRISMVAALWGHGPCILLTAGAAHLVAPTHALNIEIRAERSTRVRRLARQSHCSLATAARDIDDDDERRRRFIREGIGADPEDSSVYDISVDLRKQTIPSVVSAVVERYRAKFRRLPEQIPEDESGVHRKRPWFLDAALPDR